MSGVAFATPARRTGKAVPALRPRGLAGVDCGPGWSSPPRVLVLTHPGARLAYCQTQEETRPGRGKPASLGGIFAKAHFRENAPPGRVPGNHPRRRPSHTLGRRRLRLRGWVLLAVGSGDGGRCDICRTRQISPPPQPSRFVPVRPRGLRDFGALCFETPATRFRAPAGVFLRLRRCQNTPPGRGVP